MMLRSKIVLHAGCVLISAAIAANVCLGQHVQQPPRRTIIATGWDVSSVSIDELLESADLFANTPIDGIYFNLCVTGPDGKRHVSSHPDNSLFVWRIRL